MASYSSAYHGARAELSGKAPSGWSAAQTSSRRSEEVMDMAGARRDAVADRAAAEGGGGGGGGGGARLPFMIQNLYLAPCKTGSGPAYTHTRAQPKDVQKPTW
ncbi:unnamed protein product [Polarella glacialis]|uniref:Uncharacterized protein n=1 Tax=Polarella glacialis TaxID=89957 RepID=A0A813GDA7_POLGL|nr:unnamed protein product [Polarella glacialis]|mmetsp:Transcript_2094/g.3207  ORF Transcript_2094/g.3207 Transcript_2094/m.3207 type:complete len:103 (+) Transcript_2094:92-400(+)